MYRKFARPGPLVALALVLAAAALGCTGSKRGERGGLLDRLGGGPGRSEEELKASVGWIDPEAQSAGRGTIRSDDLLAFSNRVRAANKPPVPFPRKTVLVISGGGAYGAHPAGVLVGWTATGTRPEFDVVTGVSTGALVGAFAFLGPEFDCELQHYYTTVRNEDIYRRHGPVRALLADSLADSTPLKNLIREVATDERIARFAAEHRKGRRFYVSSTDLDARRGLVWDMGAIAARDTPWDRELFRTVLLASATIPAFFPPVHIPVNVDGRVYVERHVDGGTTSSMFFAPPWVPTEQRPALPHNWLHGSDLYILLAGKLYPDPTPARGRAIDAARNAVSTIVYDQTRSDLHKLFLLSIQTGMNYNLSVIPKDLPTPKNSTDFEPAQMSLMFNAGAAWAVGGPRWRTTPPGYEPGEGARFRAGTVLTDRGPEGLTDEPQQK